MELELQETKRKQRRFQHPLFRPIQLDFDRGIGGRNAEPVLTLCFGGLFHEKIDFSILAVKKSVTSVPSRWFSRRSWSRSMMENNGRFFAFKDLFIGTPPGYFNAPS